MTNTWKNKNIICICFGTERSWVHISDYCAQFTQIRLPFHSLLWTAILMYVHMYRYGKVNIPNRLLVIINGKLLNGSQSMARSIEEVFCLFIFCIFLVKCIRQNHHSTSISKNFNSLFENNRNYLEINFLRNHWRKLKKFFYANISEKLSDLQHHKWTTNTIILCLTHIQTRAMRHSFRMTFQ